MTQNEFSDTDVCTPTWLKIVSELATWMSAISACLDPLLYIFLCKEYRGKTSGDEEKYLCWCSF